MQIPSAFLSFPLLHYRSQKNKSNNHVRPSETTALLVPIPPKPIGLDNQYINKIVKMFSSWPVEILLPELCTAVSKRDLLLE